MVSMRGIFVVLLLISMAAAGCINGDGDDPAPADDDDEGDETTARIVGQVLRDDFEAVVEGEVYLILDDELVDDTFTDEQGMYAFDDVEAGDYRVRVSHPCCEDDLQRVRVTAGTTLEHNPQLKFIPEPESWVEILEWTGFVGCSLHIFGQPWNCPDDNAETDHRFTVQPGLQSIVVWMEWETTPLSTSPDMRHWLHIPADEGRAAVRHDAPSPIEYRVDDTDDITLPLDEIEEETEFRMQVWGSAQGMALTHQQAFTVHYHLFYGLPAPSGYTAEPDA